MMMTVVTRCDSTLYTIALHMLREQKLEKYLCSPIGMVHLHHFLHNQSIHYLFVKY